MRIYNPTQAVLFQELANGNILKVEPYTYSEPVELTENLITSLKRANGAWLEDDEAFTPPEPIVPDTIPDYEDPDKNIAPPINSTSGGKIPSRGGDIQNSSDDPTNR